MIDLATYFGNLAVNIVGTFGYFGVVIGTAFFPSEIIMPLAGVAVSQGKMTLGGIIAAAIIGDVSGALIIYGIAYIGGRPLMEKYGKYILIDQDKLEQADAWFEKYGPEAVLISKLLPIMGRVISVPAGITKMSLKKFVTYTFIGTLPFAVTLGYLGVQLGIKWPIIKEYLDTWDIIIVTVVFISILVYLIYKKRINTK
ncbi:MULTISPECIES: DedA family protein [Methanobacterium]|uniref:DedA family protein n=1 Tax=Methanobacterium veterum TaxID=408577 RepID=A0A9E5A0F7_9EURY|nr:MULTISPECIES: DedA family protein [Methanobacterium]MCZ3367431.1 DedA family protein [Methanobacterium veterum]MCZ3373421.1 DedA family protein [Methanobacterium veterum]